MLKNSFITLLLLVVVSACATPKILTYSTDDSHLSSPPKREFRAVWIASVANIDFPSQKRMDSKMQREEFVSLLNTHEQNNLNAVIVQVRPAGDALYPSLREPWSEFLTGKMGALPVPYYDPLAFMIEETHERGMEFHAWFNPFRAIFSLKNLDSLPSQHVVKQHPEWFLKTEKNLIFNPGIPEVREFVTDIIAEVVMRYDIDGVHLDDYFYPYPDQGSYNDTLTYEKYGKGRFASIADWRRDNINQFIKETSQRIKYLKPYVKFGVSPCAVWRNENKDAQGSKTKAIAAYDDLYADTRLWLQQGWIDYLAPQIYFSTESKSVPYPHMVEWWKKNSFGRHIYVGHALYKINNDSDTRWQNPTELSAQIRVLRGGMSEGSVFYRSKFLENNPAHIQDSLKANFYRFKALPPLLKWIDSTPPPPPANLTVSGSRKGAVLHWQTPAFRDPFEKPTYYVVYRFLEGEKIDIENPKHIKAILRQQEGFYIDPNVEQNGKYIYVVTALDRLHNESLPTQSKVFKYKKAYLKQ